MIPPREIKKGIDKGCKICYNVCIADTKDRKCHKKIKSGLDRFGKKCYNNSIEKTMRKCYKVRDDL